MMQSANVGLIGYGLSGKVFHAPLITAVDRLTLTKVVSSDPAKVQRDYPDMAVVGSVEALLADDHVDLVVVASPNTTHFAFARQALLAGKHVIVEKPFTNRVSQADKLIDLAAGQKRLLSVYHNRRWDNDFRTLKQCLEKEMLGQIYTYEARYDRFRLEVRDRWRERDEEGAGILYDLGSHLIDQALHLFGLPETVFADLEQQRPGAKAVDYFHLILGYSNLRVILHGGSIVRESAWRYAVHGDRGSFIKRGLDPQEDDIKAGKRPGDPGWGMDREEWFAHITTEQDGLTVRGRIETLPGAYEAYYAGMAAALLDGTPVPVTAVDGRNAIAVIEAAVESHETGRVVDFESVLRAG